MDVVVFGAGYWGVNYIRELGRHCVLVVEPNERRAYLAHSRFGVRVVSELPEGVPFDGAVIATPPNMHAEIAIPLLRKGKYVLVEKPFATTLEDAATMAAFQNCMAAHVYLWHPEVVQLRGMSDFFGDGNHVFLRRTNHGPIRPWQNALWDLAPHDISIVLSLAHFKLPSFVSAWVTHNAAFLRMNYEHWDAFGYVSWLGGPKVRRLEIVRETQMRIVFEDLKTILEEPPLTRMIKDFINVSWDDRGAGEVGVSVVRVLSDADSHH